MNKTKIEWTNYTWNPVVGCKHNCWYCYGKRIAKRFFKDNPNYEPKFYPERLNEPYKLKKPSKIFVCSMADLFGDWVSRKWIEAVIKVAKDNPQHTFQFLTKNPKRYLEFEFLKNCWLGITIDGTEEKMIAQKKIEYLCEKRTNHTFISFEPLLGSMALLDISRINWIIVGAMTGPKAIKPKKEWIDSIKHPNIFYKNNIKKYL